MDTNIMIPTQDGMRPVSREELRRIITTYEHLAESTSGFPRLLWQQVARSMQDRLDDALNRSEDRA